MFSPLADTTFSSFFSGAVTLGWTRSGPPPTSWVTPPPRPALEDAPSQPEQPPSSWSRTAPSDAFLHSVHTTPFFSPDPGFSLVLGLHRASPGWLRPCSSTEPRVQSQSVSGSKMSQGRLPASLDDSVSADWGLLTFSSTVVFLFRPKTPKLQLSPGGRSLASARHPVILRPLTDARIKTAGSRPLLRLPLNTGHIVLMAMNQSV